MDVNTIVADACANGGALLHYWLELALGVPVVASLLANARNRLPGWAVWLLDRMALNFIKGEADKAASPNKG